MTAHAACEVLVVGGGPGGATVAALLARLGHDVVVLEAQPFPRYQIGESLIPATVHGIAKILGVADELERAGFQEKHGGTYLWGSGTSPWEFRFSDSEATARLGFGSAYQVERSRFDAILLDHAAKMGARVYHGQRAIGAVCEGGRVVGVRVRDDRGDERVWRAVWVVDASGHKSTLYRQAGERRYSEFFRNVALFGYYEGGARMPGDNEGDIVLATFADGWFWYIPLRADLTSVGAVVDRSAARRIASDPEAVLEAMLDECPFIRGLLSGARRVRQGVYGKVRTRVDYSYTTTSLWTRGLVLVGDAACFVDPVFSSGVHLATYAGWLAARSIHTALSSDLDEARCMMEFEAYYRREYAAFYDFLLSFYDMHQAPDSYFWAARKVLRTPERANEAFVRLVAGAGTTLDQFFALREGSGELFQALASAMAESEPAAVDALLRGLTPEKRAVTERAARQPGVSDLLATASLGVGRSDPGGLAVSADGMRWIAHHS